MRVIEKFSSPIIDRKIGGRCWFVRTTVQEYLEMVKLDGNPYQRSLLGLKSYTKLINDILDDTSFPPISVVSSLENIDLTNNLEIAGKFQIIDGLQRTNCLFHCADLLQKGVVRDRVFTTFESFKNKQITLEVWEKLDFKNILYKMLVLNTGQKKMDYGHQLDILNDSFFEKLQSDGISVATRAEQASGNYDKTTQFLLSDVTEGLVSFINRYPISGKKDAAEFLFERFNISLDIAQEEESLNTISDDQTYEYIKWTLTTFSSALDQKYGVRNPLKKYNVFLIGFCASLGNSYKKNAENLRVKIAVLMERIESNSDPLGLDIFEKYYSLFTSGIGEKRRKFVFEAMRHFFSSPSIVDSVEWDSTYESNF